MPDSAFINEPAIAALLQNLVLLMVIAAIPDLSIGRSGRIQPALLPLIRGTLIGIVGIAMMAAAFEVAPGIVVDARSVLLSVSGLFFGAIPTLVAVVVMTAFRITAGHPEAMLFGVALIASSGGIGVLWNHLRGWVRGPYRVPELYVFGLVVSLVQVGLLFTLPAAPEVLVAIGVPAIVIFPSVTVVLGRAIEARLQRRRTEAALIESDERLRFVLDHVELGTYDFGVAGGEVVADHRCAQMLGYDTLEYRESLDDWAARMHPDDRESAMRTLRDYLDGALPAYRSEFRLTTAAGTYIWILSLGMVVDRDAAGAPRRMIGVRMDVSRRHETEERLRASADETTRLLEKEVRSRRALLSIAEDARVSAGVLRESEARYRSLVQHSPVAVLVFRGEQLTLANEAGLRIFGAGRPEELVGRAPWDLFRLPGNATAQVAGHPHVTVDLEGTGDVTELQIIRLDGAARDVQMAAAPFDEQGVRHIHVVLQDITDRLAAEAEVRRLNADLEARVTARTAELAAANKELEAFSSSVSHDLRAPVRAVVSFGELLDRKYSAQLDETGTHYLDTILAQGRRMGTLIDDLLDYSRLGRVPIRTRPVPLEPMLRELEQTFAGRISEIGAVFEIPSSPPVVMADPMLLHQVLLNLIDNAVTYRRLDGTPRITVSTAQHRGTTTLAVVDNGIGIPKDIQEKMFEVFTRGHTDAEYPGTGIGLATVRKAARRMGSDVTVESTLGVGTTFRLNLPTSPQGSST